MKFKGCKRVELKHLYLKKYVGPKWHTSSDMVRGLQVKVDQLYDLYYICTEPKT